MSRYTWADLRLKNATGGQEFNNGEPIPGTLIAHLNCEYCGTDIISVFDEHNKKNWYPYLGKQVERSGVYEYSEAVQKIKSFYGVGDGEIFTQERGNNFMNCHARFHSQPNNWKYRASPQSIRMLCNNCFLKTYNRMKIEMEDGTIAALSVLENETVEQVAEDLGIKNYKVLGKGAVPNY